MAQRESRFKVLGAQRICARCGVSIALRDKRSRHCSALCRNRDYENAAIGTFRACLHCDVAFSASKGTHRYCSKTCRDKADLIRNRAAYNQRNARRRAAQRMADTAEVFTREEVFDRDGWICQLCLGPMDWNLRGRNPLAPALDHRVPLNRGGLHSWDNVQAAHFGCNARKSDRMDVVVLPVPVCA